MVSIPSSINQKAKVVFFYVSFKVRANNRLVRVMIMYMGVATCTCLPVRTIDVCLFDGV